MLPNLGFTEILLLLALFLLLFGARRLPEIGASLGKGIREFKRSLSDVADAVNNVPPEEPSSGRSLDAPTSSASTGSSGEPKRLSQ